MLKNPATKNGEFNLNMNNQYYVISMYFLQQFPLYFVEFTFGRLMGCGKLLKLKRKLVEIMRVRGVVAIVLLVTSTDSL